MAVRKSAKKNAKKTTVARAKKTLVRAGKTAKKTVAGAKKTVKKVATRAKKAGSTARTLVKKASKATHTATKRATQVGTVLERVGQFIEAGAAAVENAVTSVEKRTPRPKKAATKSGSVKKRSVAKA
jgi:hypothetical protein